MRYGVLLTIIVTGIIVIVAAIKLGNYIGLVLTGQ